MGDVAPDTHILISGNNGSPIPSALFAQSCILKGKHVAASFPPMHPSKAFTLIELLVVIAIIAILAVVIVLTLNPADLLRQSRDSNRLSDLDTITHALTIYSADQGGGSNFNLGTSSVTYISIPDPAAATAAGSDCSALGFPAGGNFHCAGPNYYKKTDGTGWIPVNFTQMSTGVPLSSLPIDPTNQSSTDLYYSYTTDGSTFELIANPESQKYLALAGANSQLFRSGSNQNLGGGSNWVLVPGNSTFGTSNFWVMQYDAKCAQGGTSLGTVGQTTTQVSIPTGTQPPQILRSPARQRTGGR